MGKKIGRGSLIFTCWKPLRIASSVSPLKKGRTCAANWASLNSPWLLVSWGMVPSSYRRGIQPTW